MKFWLGIPYVPLIKAARDLAHFPRQIVMSIKDIASEMDLLRLIRNNDTRRSILRRGPFPCDDRGQYQQNGTSDAGCHEIMLVGKGCKV
jgi:hypothetical protein